MHLGSAFRKLDREKGDKRRSELRSTFERTVDHAAKNGFEAVLICGDLFDTARPTMDDKRFFYKLPRRYPNLKFFYLRGNHDTEEGFDETLPNLYTFGPEPSSFDLGEAVISGCELPAGEEELYADYSPVPGRVNILMLHGQLSEGGSAPEGVINKKKLEEKNIDYLALGHIHSYGEIPLGEGVAVYPGCLEGRGYDEIGIHGFVEIEIENGRVSHRFVPFAQREIILKTVDLTGTSDAEEAIGKVRASAESSPKDMIRIELTGEVTFETGRLPLEIGTRLSGSFFDVSVKDLTVPATDYSGIAKQISLRGEFYRTVMGSDDLSDEDRADILRFGIGLLDGKKWKQ
ncbi:MAG: metallophosphoesterase [Clostridia bacterium]|nr:metallophosphoesterase [Clostridia bacterium]